MKESEYVDNLEERKDTYDRFWKGENLGRPIVSIQAKRDAPRTDESSPAFPSDLESRWLDPDYVIPSRLKMLSTSLGT